MRPKITRIIALALAAGAALVVVGCYGSEETSTDTAQETTDTTTAPAGD